jgi:predicted enzyme related to lactoylglutathione lyase
MANGFAHCELSTGDVAQAKKFYKSVFDWKLNDVKGMPYTMVDVGKGGVGGGITKTMMPGQPTAWMPYVEVADVKKSLAKAKKAGGKVVLDFHPIGEMGAIGVFLDPTGAALGVWEGAKKAPAKKAAAKPAKKKAAAKPAKKKAAAKRR